MTEIEESEYRLEIGLLKELCAEAANALELHVGFDRERTLIAKLRKAAE